MDYHASHDLSFKNLKKSKVHPNPSSSSSKSNGRKLTTATSSRSPRRIREWKPISPLWTTTDENKWFVLFLSLHEGRVFKTFQHCCLALNPCVRNVANFVAVECSPMLTVVLAVKV